MQANNLNEMINYIQKATDKINNKIMEELESVENPIVKAKLFRLMQFYALEEDDEIIRMLHKLMVKYTTLS